VFAPGSLGAPSFRVEAIGPTVWEGVGPECRTTHPQPSPPPCGPAAAEHGDGWGPPPPAGLPEPLFEWNSWARAEGLLDAHFGAGLSAFDWVPRNPPIHVQGVGSFIHVCTNPKCIFNKHALHFSALSFA